MFRRIGSTSPIMRVAPCGSPTRSPPSPKSCTEALGGSWAQGCRAMVCEATGGYERPLMLVAAQLGLPLRRVHPNRARAFATAAARLAKTDAIDARMLARFAAFIADEPARPSPAPRPGFPPISTNPIMKSMTPGSSSPTRMISRPRSRCSRTTIATSCRASCSMCSSRPCGARRRRPAKSRPSSPARLPHQALGHR